MLIDESKMAVDSSVSFMNCRKQQHQRLSKDAKKNKFSPSKIAPPKLVAADQFRSHTTAIVTVLRLHKPIADTQFRLNCLMLQPL